MTTTTAARLPRATAPRVRRESGLPLTVAALGFFMLIIDTTAVNVALAAMGRDLHAATAGLQWVADAYTLPLAALLLSAGALSDRLGARRVFGIGTATFTVASALCGAAPSLGVLTGARLAQGAAAALMLPSSLALIQQGTADARRRARGIAIWTAAGASAMAAGPVLGGLLVTEWSWRGVFWINVPVGVVSLAILNRGVPRSARKSAALDLPGQLLATAALAGLTWAVIEGGSKGFGTAPVLAGFAVFLVAGTAFVSVESRVAAPAVPLRLFRQRATLTVIGAGFAANAAWYGIAFVLGLYAQQVRGASPLAAGLMFAPMAVVVAALNLISPRAAAGRFGARGPVAGGTLITAIGTLALLGTGPVWLTALLLLPVSMIGLAMPTLTTLMLESVGPAQAGLAGGVFNTSRQVGSALGVAGYGALITGSFRPGMQASLIISTVLLAGAALACATLRPASPA